MSRKHIYCCHSPNFHINVSMCVCVASSMHVTALARLTTAHSHMRTKLQSADLQLYRESTAFKTVCSYILVYYCNIQKKKADSIRANLSLSCNILHQHSFLMNLV